MQYEEERTNPVTGAAGLTTERAVGAIVIGSLILLIFIRRGFRGINVPGVGSASVG